MEQTIEQKQVEYPFGVELKGTAKGKLYISYVRVKAKTFQEVKEGIDEILKIAKKKISEGEIKIE